MNNIPEKCSKCVAPIELDPYKHFVKCSYCGTTNIFENGRLISKSDRYLNKVGEYIPKLKQKKVFIPLIIFSILLPFGIYKVNYIDELLAKSDFSSIFIKSCYDGDTCTAIDGEKIRLACIDTPELKGKNSDPAKAKEARDFLNKLVANKEISIKRITKDRYGRTVAELFKDGVNIQQLIVNKGYGKIYKKYSYQCEWSN